MTHVSQSAVGAILNTISDVIEGGNAYAGGTSFNGIPGRQSNDAGLRVHGGTPITASSNGSTTLVYQSSGNFDTGRWLKNETPGFFLVCTSATNAGNEDKARRVTGVDNTNKRYTVDAFPYDTSSGDVFVVAQGFKRLPNNIDIDIEATAVPHGYDRFFQVLVTPVGFSEWHGSAFATLQAELTIRLRLLKYGRSQDAIASMFENLGIFRSVLTMQEHRETTYTRALVADPEVRPEILVDDRDKIVVADKYTLYYSIDRTY